MEDRGRGRSEGTEPRRGRDGGGAPGKERGDRARSRGSDEGPRGGGRGWEGRSGGQRRSGERGFDSRRSGAGADDRGFRSRAEGSERGGFSDRPGRDGGWTRPQRDEVPPRRDDAGARGRDDMRREHDETARRGADRPRRWADSARGEGSRDERANRFPNARAGQPDRRRGGEGAGRGLDRRPPRPDEPDLPDEVQAGELDPTIRRDLLSLDKGNAETVARHLVMAARLLDDDPRLALAHARAARQRAGRIAVVRETAGVVAYHAGEWAEALSELRTARRMSGGSGLLAVMADCERGLGRPERAIELGRSEEARALSGAEASELRIVVAGARMDLGQYDQAVVTLQTPELDPARTGSAAARLFYAYADALVAAGRTEEGLTWFLNAAAADIDGETDAEERAAELTGEL
ncbi:hypothetical protein B0T36_22335 [Nocardia donostiensis]|nr:hypothetical protein B0T36_22335 [Nocardia donostiensis]